MTTRTPLPRPPHPVDRLDMPELDALLAVYDRAAADAATLQSLWERARPMIPTTPSIGSTAEYDDLRARWAALCAGLPAVAGVAMPAPLPDIEDLGEQLGQCWVLGESPADLLAEADAPARAMDDYRSALHTATRRAARARQERLSATSGRTLMGSDWPGTPSPSSGRQSP
jgi:hypothetical protein